MRDFQQIDLIQQSLLKSTGSPPEIYIPLWWWSGGYVGTTSTSPGSSFLQRNSSTIGGSPSAAGAKLHTLNASWPSTTKFAFEAAIYNSSGSNTTNAALWDITASSIVSGTQISVASTTATVVRSGQVTLIPGHQYGVTVWCNAGTAYVTDASLIVFPS